MKRGFALFMLVSGAASADTYDVPPRLTNGEQFNEAGAAFGFCLAQQRSFELARQHHPDLARTASLVEQQFNSRTGDACGSLERQMQRSVEAIEFGKWPSFRTSLVERLALVIVPQLEVLGDRSIAAQFVEDVRSRSEGEIDVAIASQLIRASEKFRKSPESQWPRWTRTWETAASPEAKGLTVRVRVPLSFVEADPNATHMLRKWTLPLANDGTYVMLNVSHFPFLAGESLPQAMAEFESTSPEQMGAYSVEGLTNARLLKSRAVTALRRPAFVLESEAEGSAVGYEGRMRMHMLMALVPTGSVSIGCIVGVPKTNSAHLAALADRYAPLCLLFLSSLTDASKP
ncbi:hypothetical protein [Arenimonas metalli]|nr:hypothetical protein [Arenimonas metalli]